MSANPQIETAPVSTSEKSLKLREVCFEDYAQVAALAAKFQLYTESYPGWKHLWTNNPAYREIKDKFPMGWVLENAEGAVCGYLGNIPLHYEFEGKTLLAATTRAWVVDTPYRLYSLWLLEAYFQQPNVDLFLSTTVNPQSALGFSFFQGVRVPVGDWDRTLFWITNYRGFTESFLRKKLAAMAEPLSYPLSFGLFLGDRFRRSRIRGSRVVKAVSCASFDDRFEAFWATQRSDKYHLLLAVRSREVLEWHFKFALLQNAAWIYVVEGDSGLAAYSVFLRHDYPEIGLTRLRLADFQCLEPQNAPGSLAAMLEVAMDRCRQEGIHMFEVIGLAPELEKELERASPHRRVMPNWLYFYKANNPSLAAQLTNAAVWEPSLFDGDSSLWSENLVTGNSKCSSVNSR
jgi:hypothetical protein